MKLVLKNGKSIASITTLSLLISSILILLFSFCYNFLKTYIIKNSSSGHISSLQFIIYVALVVSVELSFIYAYSAITRASGIAATLATATSYTDTAKLSSQHLFSIVKTKWRSPFPFMRRRDNYFLCGGSHSYSWRYLMHLLLFAAVGVAILLVRSNPNPLTITIMSLVAVAFFVSQLYTSVAWTLSAVIPVVEDGCEEEALEKSEKLVQGQRLHGFMLNLFIYLLAFIVVFSFWKIVGDKGSLNLMVYGLFIVNCISLLWILMSVVYTMYYFQCMEYHGQTIHPLGINFHYTRLPS
ncbi:hypothetical protein C2S53_003216 [Perilla frutescens var. hirtella]|uniref:Uncharacterized protein n=1 Tax=Perilla frutescens var. hirtella TaxID=608512 RepID=A0AAD4JLU2_PERFH|nr:hypothetical protein C2S53_003216 [Perilla frutescens var. hirtella]